MASPWRHIFPTVVPSGRGRHDDQQMAGKTLPIAMKPPLNRVEAGILTSFLHFFSYR
jgi:hypothetical protein